jgi:hypothetical protein
MQELEWWKGGWDVCVQMEGSIAETLAAHTLVKVYPP